MISSDSTLHYWLSSFRGLRHMSKD
uniref:Uncharacterized protein n=1 Tax=Anguilla anguilla TaxID=7936 RepID=A0A0E9WE74_ANGAN